MKRYECRMNDGEYCASFHQLKDAKNIVMKTIFALFQGGFASMIIRSVLILFKVIWGRLRVESNPYLIPHDSVMEIKLY